jgi:hypothetical protein
MFQLAHGAHDTIKWKITSDGNYSTYLAYKMQFEGPIPTTLNALIS